MSVFIYHQHLVVTLKLSQKLTFGIAIQTTRHIIPPNLHAAQGRAALFLQINAFNRVFGDLVAPGTLSFDRQLREIIFDALNPRIGHRTQMQSHFFGLSVGVG
jgi:hypothetical protein